MVKPKAPGVKPPKPASFKPPVKKTPKELTAQQLNDLWITVMGGKEPSPYGIPQPPPSVMTLAEIDGWVKDIEAMIGSSSKSSFLPEPPDASNTWANDAEFIENGPPHPVPEMGANTKVIAQTLSNMGILASPENIAKVAGIEDVANAGDARILQYRLEQGSPDALAEMKAASAKSIQEAIKQQHAQITGKPPSPKPSFNATALDDLVTRVVEKDPTLSIGDIVRRAKAADPGAEPTGSRAQRVRVQQGNLSKKAESLARTTLRSGDLPAYADFLRAQGVNPDTIARVLSGELDMSPAARARRALSMGLDPGAEFTRIDEPLKTQFQGRGRAGLTYMGLNEQLARTAEQIGHPRPHVYPLISTPNILGLKASGRSLGPVGEAEAARRILAQLNTDAQGNYLTLDPHGEPHLTPFAAEDIEAANLPDDLIDETYGLIAHLEKVRGLDNQAAAVGSTLRRSLLERAADSETGHIELPQTTGKITRPLHYGYLEPNRPGPADHANYNTAARMALRDYIREIGMDGMLVQDEAGVSLATSSPNKLRHSQLAALDPEFKDTSNIYNSYMPLTAAAAGGTMAAQAQQQSETRLIPDDQVANPPMPDVPPDYSGQAGQALTDLVRRPGESLGSYLVRAQSMTKAPYQRQVPDERTALAKLTGDMTNGISDNELEDWYMTLDEKTIPEHEQFKENVAATLGEQVFTVAPVDKFDEGVSGYLPASFDQFFMQTILPEIEADYGTIADAPQVQEHVVARLMGEPHDFQDENIKKYTTMVLDNLKEGQSIDSFPAMSQEEADEAYAKYGTKARFYIGQENRDNFGRKKAYGLLQTFADGEHAPPLQGLSSAIAGTAGQMYTNLTDVFFPRDLFDPQPGFVSNDGGNGYENASVATDALGGPLGRVRQANKFYARATEDPEFVRDPVTGANYADESNLGMAGMGNHGARSDGYYQYASNALKNQYDNSKFLGGLDPLVGLTLENNQIQPPEVMSELNQHERMNNRTTPIVPGGRYVSETDDKDTSPAEDAAELFKDYKVRTAEAFDRGYRERTGMNPTQFQSSMGNLLREVVTDPATLAGTVLSAGYGGLLGGLKGAVKPVTLGLGREIVEEGLFTGGLESLLTGPSYFTEPLEGAGYGPYDPQNKAVEAIEQSRKQAKYSAKAAADLMRQQRSPIGESLLPQGQPALPYRRPGMNQMPPKSRLQDL